MNDTITLQMAQRGLITLPKTLRDAYDMGPGTELTLLDLGGGVFVLSLRRSEVDRLADNVREALVQSGESLESMLRALREERERYAEASNATDVADD